MFYFSFDARDGLGLIASYPSCTFFFILRHGGGMIAPRWRGGWWSRCWPLRGVSMYETLMRAKQLHNCLELLLYFVAVAVAAAPHAAVASAALAASASAGPNAPAARTTRAAAKLLFALDPKRPWIPFTAIVNRPCK